MNLKKSFITAIVLSTIGIVSWEFYWRNQGEYPTLDDNKDLWAVERSKVVKATAKDVVLTGSSRVLFDIQLDEWNAVTGNKPIQLASAGSSPLPIFHDIVENTNFKGTVIVGVTPGLFFSTTFPQAMPWKRAQNRVNHFHKRTYAQQLNHLFSIPLQLNLAFMSASEEEWANDIDLKALLRRIKLGNRTGQPMAPPFYSFHITRMDRNTKMTQKTVQDTAFANTVKKVWQFFGNGAPPPDKKSTMEFFVKDAEKFIKRGGNLVLLRPPSSGYYKEGEAKFLSREEFWDELVKNTGAKGYHYNDYQEFQNLNLPEWSHLSVDDAVYFTTELAKIMIKDGTIPNSKNN